MITENQILFQKEPLLNVAETFVPAEYDKIAWLDSDIWFQNQNWFSMTESLLGQNKVVQMFDVCRYGSRLGSPFKTKHSFINSSPTRRDGHPGFAWAAQRQFWSVCGGLYARSILGCGDALAAAAFTGMEHIKEGSAGANLSNYREWQKEVSAWVDHKFAVVPGSVYHEWHGNLENRAYRSRRDIIKKIDLTLVTQFGENKLVEWTQNAPEELKTAVRNYFLERKEDG